MCTVWNSKIYVKDRLLSCDIAKCDEVAGLLFATASLKVTVSKATICWSYFTKLESGFAF